ncbi:hypothetical protein ABZX85_22910 [Streptomyces sp. NPDC004539]|uniref:hypothetical protein n=1 Tax=Streptomyces sp. NPDC004539 TaxID=3154280 RepID=UPI0033AB3338
MSRALPKYNKRRVGLIGGAAAVVLSGAVIAGTALAGQDSSDNTTTNAKTLAASPGTISCPDVASQLPAIPASAQAEVTRNLQLLQTQIQEANTRLVNTVGQGGPNFVQNAIVGPLKDKRVATINRIATAIGRTAAKPVGLDALAPCSVGNAGTNAGGNTGNAGNTGNTGNAGNTGNTGNTGNNNAGNNNGNAGNNNGNAGNAAGVGTISCPDVASQLPAIPATAQAEVTRNLQLLQTQIQEANTRLVNTVGQGGPNFVQNAIVGPLKDKRVATINRIATAIGRTAAKPVGLDALAPCTVNQ